jgi:hypothetical protein
MKDIIRHILKEEKINQKVQRLIEDGGILDAIEIVGGMDVFISIMGNDYFTKERKIDVIKDIASEYGDNRGILFLSDFDIEVNIGREEFNDGSYEETFIRYVDSDKGGIFYKTYDFDEEGWMMDEPVDTANCLVVKVDVLAVNEGVCP